MRFLICTTLVLFFALPSHGRLFKNAYVQFELPANWDCQMEGTEWVCSSKNKNDSKESIIILTAKEVGPQDSLAAYEAYLKKPKPLVQQNGKTTGSIVKTSKQRRIQNHPWIDALHLGSEIPSYYTRYLATVKDKLAILVTLSAHQKYYTKYSNDFFKAVESLRVIATKDLFENRQAAKSGALGRPATESFGNTPAVPIPQTMGRDDAVGGIPEEGEGQNSRTALMVLGLILMAIAGYLFLKKR